MTTILILASLLRLWGITYGLPQLYHPDEPNKIEMAQRMFKTGDLNPHYFKKPTLFIYLNAALYVPYYLIGKLAGIFNTPSDIPAPIVISGGAGLAPMPSVVLMGRLLTAAVSVLSIWLVYKVGRAASGRASVGLLSALLLSISSTHVYHARYITVNTFLTAAVVGVSWFALRILNRGKTSDYLLAGAVTGLAISFKYPGALVAILIPVAHCLRSGRLNIRDSKLWLAVAAIPIAFLIGTPYAILDWRKFVEDVLYEYTHYSTGSLGMEGDPLRWYLSYAWRSEGLIALAGGVGVVWSLVRRRSDTLLLSSFAVAYFTFIFTFTVRNGRTFLPLVPFLCVLSAAVAVELGTTVLKLRRNAHWISVVLCMLPILSVGLAKPLSDIARAGYRQTTQDARVTARAWIDENLPEGSKVAVESYSTFVSPSRYRVIGVGMIPENSMQWYIDQGFDYLVFGEGMYGRFYADPDRYAHYVDQYDTYFDQLTLLKIVDDGGYEIRIYLPDC